MAQSAPATSILELLTHPNPTIHHRKPKSKTNSRKPTYYWPKQIKKWEEFEDADILKSVFGGSLLQEACQSNRNLPPYPQLHSQAYCIVSDEPDTRDVIHNWNKWIVSAALDPIQHVFHPAIWSKGDPPKSKDKHPLPPRQEERGRNPPSRRSSNRARQPRSQSLSRLQPDSGSVAWSPLSPNSDIADLILQERFPKEYKPSTKWKSEGVFRGGLLDNNGKFLRGKISHNLAWPLRQAYTYCIQHMCRYGCILTCEEAFIFRIMPREGKPADVKVLRNELINNGLMEYVAIPWDNHSSGSKEHISAWTVNLALWFVHILAGNNFEVSWSYVDLTAETLVLSQPDVDIEQSPSASKKVQDIQVARDKQDEEDERSETSEESDTTNIRTPLISKRKRNTDDEEEEEDGFHLSFSKRQNI
ncbi:hypothetical protein HG530_005679 [Fusarium avenaceum]|nr:hypothetical protein HG530_005679 [Fusarium avenaceum]